MNRFEILMAPTISKSSLLALLASAPTEGISNELKQSSRVDLLNPNIRLYDELTTVRIEEPYEGDDLGYRDFCLALNKSDTIAISPHYAGNWYKSVISCGDYNYPSLVNSSKFIKLVEILSRNDPWLIQGAAAIALRTGLIDETNPKKNPLISFQNSFLLYQYFFKLAILEDSYSFQFFKEEQQRNNCRQIWNNFLINIVEEMVKRGKTYIANSDTISLNHVLSILNQPFIEGITPGIYIRALDEYRLPYKQSILNATLLKDALASYENCPSSIRQGEFDNELFLSIISAMIKECNIIESDIGDLDLISNCALKFSLLTIGNSKGKLLETEIQNFFKTCSVLIVKFINSKDFHSNEVRKKIRIILAFLPKDFQIARNPDQTWLIAKDIYFILLRSEISSEIKKYKIFSEDISYKLGQSIFKKISEQFSDEEMQFKLFLYSFNIFLENFSDQTTLAQQAEVTKFTLKYLSPFPSKFISLANIDKQSFYNVQNSPQSRQNFVNDSFSDSHIKERLFTDIERIITVTIEEIDKKLIFDLFVRTKYIAKILWSFIEQYVNDPQEQSYGIISALNILLKRQELNTHLNQYAFLSNFPSDIPYQDDNGNNTIGQLASYHYVLFTYYVLENYFPVKIKTNNAAIAAAESFLKEIVKINYISHKKLLFNKTFNMFCEKTLNPFLIFSFLEKINQSVNKQEKELYDEVFALTFLYRRECRTSKHISEQIIKIFSNNPVNNASQATLVALEINGLILKNITDNYTRRYLIGLALNIFIRKYICQSFFYISAFLKIFPFNLSIRVPSEILIKGDSQNQITISELFSFFKLPKKSLFTNLSFIEKFRYTLVFLFFSLGFYLSLRISGSLSSDNFLVFLGLTLLSNEISNKIFNIFHFVKILKIPFITFFKLIFPKLFLFSITIFLYFYVIKIYFDKFFSILH